MINAEPKYQTEYWDKTGIRADIKNTLQEYHDHWSPEKLGAINNGGVLESLDPTREFIEALATHDIPIEGLEQNLPTFFTNATTFYGDCTKIFDDCGQSDSSARRIYNETRNYFSALAVSDLDTQVKWAQGVRTSFKTARDNLEQDLQKISAQLGQVDLCNSMLVLSREEWIILTPSILDSSPPYSTQKFSRDTGFNGMRVFPTLEDSTSIAITILDTNVLFDGTSVSVIPQYEKAQTTQRHEAAHLVGDISIEDIPAEVGVPDSVKLIRMGFRADIMDLATHALIKPDNTFPRSAIEEGWAHYFQLKEDPQSGLQNMSTDQRIVWQYVSEIINHMGLNNFLTARAAHNIEPVAQALKTIDPEGHMLAKLQDIEIGINKGLTSE